MRSLVVHTSFNAESNDILKQLKILLTNTSSELRTIDEAFGALPTITDHVLAGS
jgi:hypothetical protein